VNIDRPRQRDAIDRQFLIMNAISRKTGEQYPDQRDKTGDETQPNHSPTQIRVVGNEDEEAFGGRRSGHKPRCNEDEPFGIVEERSSVRNCGCQDDWREKQM
jgi:hypothetical protein